MGGRADFIHGGDDLLFFFPKTRPVEPLQAMEPLCPLDGEARRDRLRPLGLRRKKRDLVVPLDANIFKIGTCLGWTDQKAQSWKAACQITDELKKHCPEDPLKYDFFLCHVVGMDGGCTGVRNGDCAQRMFSPCDIGW